MKSRGIGTRLATWGLGLALVWGPFAHSSPPPGSSKIQVVHHNRRSFRIPVTIPKDDLKRYKQVQLWSSDDSGGTWGKADATSIDNPYFSFKAGRDGEYWFAVRVVDTKGRLIPPDDADIEPNLKVFIDTAAPSMTLDALPRRGSVVGVRWEVTDDHLDLNSFLLQYQVEGSTEWVKVPVRKRSRIGQEKWDAGTAEPIKVRASVSDLAGSITTLSLNLAEGSPSASDGSDPNTPPPMGKFASSDPDRVPPSIVSGPQPMPAFGSMSGSSVPANTGGAATPSGDHNPFNGGNTAGSEATATGFPDPANPPILVSSPRFGLQYAVEDAGPNGPAAVELYVTTDGGRTWFLKGEDPDRTPPFPVDLGGEGTFGLKLVAKSAANQGDRPPVPGEVPLTVVEVDSTKPTVKLEPPRMVGNKLVINWQASDAHPISRSVMISVRADGAGSTASWNRITPTPIENNGQFTWLVPERCPAKIHVRIDVKDALGNVGSDETSETGAVLVDRSKPKGRIIGLDSPGSGRSRN